MIKNRKNSTPEDLDDFMADLEATLLEDDDQKDDQGKVATAPVRKKKEAVKETLFEVKQKSRLLEFLFEAFAGKSKTTVKSYLSHRQIHVNDLVVTQFDYRLSPGDRVAYRTGITKAPFRHPMLSIVYEDDDLIVINKNNGLLSMASDHEREKTAYYILSRYLRDEDERNKVFIVHRLDRETSGLMMFAKSKEVQHRMQNSWSELVLERKYVAVVLGAPTHGEGVFSSYLAENAAFVVYSTSDPEEGELAVTHYKVLKQGGGNSLLELELETGKKNQIRVHMKDMGCSIIGDRKYGGMISPIGRIALHARLIRFIHPVTGKELCFDSGIPAPFLWLLRSRAR